MLKYNMSITAECCVCQEEKEEGKVFSTTGSKAYLSFYPLQIVTENMVTSSDSLSFICEDCLEKISAKTLLKLYSVGFNTSISKETVEKVVFEIILEKGFTSTLEVKNSLRKEGYIANQKNIKQTLETIFKEKNTLERILYIQPDNERRYYLYYLTDDLHDFKVTFYPENSKEIQYFLNSHATPVHIFSELVNMIEQSGAESFYDSYAIDDIDNDDSFRDFLWREFCTNGNVSIEFLNQSDGDSE